MMWSMIPCRPAMMFWSIVGHASFQTAGTMGPSMSERSYLEALIVSVVTGVRRRVYYTVAAVLFLVVFVLLSPEYASAGDGNDRLCGTWAINVWGVSYHIKDNASYDDANVGAGVRCYARPNWPGFGRNRENRLLLQIDALRNSHKGLILPASAGGEIKVGALRRSLRLVALGALTFSYYDDPGRKNEYGRYRA